MGISVVLLSLLFVRIPQAINARAIRLNQPGLSFNCLQAFWDSLPTYKRLGAGDLYKTGCFKFHIDVHVVT